MAGSEWVVRLGRGPRDAHEAWLKRGRAGEGRLDLDGVDLSGGHDDRALRGVDFKAARFIRCNLKESVIAYGTLDEAELVDCDGSLARFVHGRFERARLIGCRFVGADFRRAWWVDATIERCDLSEAWLVETPIVGSVLTGCDLRGAHVGDSQVDRCRFVGSDLRGADLRLGSFESTRFEGCDLRGARMDDRRLTATVFVACKLHGITGQPASVARLPWAPPTVVRRNNAPIPPACSIEACDFSEAGDGSDLRSAGGWSAA